MGTDDNLCAAGRRVACAAPRAIHGRSPSSGNPVLVVVGATPAPFAVAVAVAAVAVLRQCAADNDRAAATTAGGGTSAMS